MIGFRPYFFISKCPGLKVNNMYIVSDRCKDISEKVKKYKNEILIFLAISVALLGDASLYVLLPVHASDRGISIASLGVLLSVNRLVRLAVNSFIKYLHKWTGSRTLFTASITLTALSTLIYGLPVSFITLLAARIIWGCCFSSMRYIAYLKIAESSDDSNRGELTGLYNSAIRVGSLIAAPLGAALAEIAGYSAACCILAGFTFAAGLPLAVRGTSNCEQKVYDFTEREGSNFLCNNTANHEKQREKQMGLKSLYVLTFLNYWIDEGLLISTIGYILLVKFGDHIGIFGFSAGVSVAAGLLVSIRHFYTVFLSVYFGRLSDRYGRFRVVVLSCCIQAVSLAVIALSRSFLLLSIAVLAAFTGATALTNTLSAAAMDCHHIYKTKNVLGCFTTWFDIGSALGTMAGYTLMVAIGYSRTYIFSGLILTAVLGHIARKMFAGAEQANQN